MNKLGCLGPRSVSGRTGIGFVTRKYFGGFRGKSNIKFNLTTKNEALLLGMRMICKKANERVILTDSSWVKIITYDGDDAVHYDG